MLTKAERIEAFHTERQAKIKDLLSQCGIHNILIHDHRVLHWLGYPDVKYVLVTSDGFAVCENLVDSLGNKNITVGVDSYLSASDLLQIKEKLPKVQWISVGDHLSNIMAVKDRLEILMLRKSAEITHAVFKGIEQNLVSGRSELDLLYTAYETMSNSGGNGFSFEPSIGSGPRSILTWAGIETRKFFVQDPLVVDLGVSFRGYQSDMTKSYLIEDNDNTEWQSANFALKETMDIIVNKLRPGVNGSELHKLCQDTFKRLGYAGCMPHYLGHGIGLYVHEPPFLAPGSNDIVREGNVISVEPSIILEKEGMGIRREREFLITADGCEML